MILTSRVFSTEVPMLPDVIDVSQKIMLEGQVKNNLS